MKDIKKIDQELSVQKLASDIIKGGVGSGCRGDNCGRPKTNIDDVAIWDKTTLEGGSATSLVGVEAPKKGYYVSTHKDREQIIPYDQFNPLHLKEYADKNKDLLDDPKNFLGTWHNKEDNNVYLDVSEHTISLEDAKELGVKHNQLAIFDIENGKVIDL